MTRTWRWCERCEMHVDTNTQHEHESETMGRKQQAFAGMERDKTEGEIAVEEAHEKWMEARDERKKHKEREKQFLVELIVVMREHKIKKHTYRDEDGVARVVEAEADTKIRSRTLPDKPESDERKGTGVADHPTNGVHPGLLAQAEAAQRDDLANVEVTAEGDVVTPDKPVATKKKRKGKAKN